MINTLLAFDKTDESLGNFFEICHTLTSEILQTETEINIDSINGDSLTEAAISIKTSLINHNPFIFISYSHGSETELLKKGIIPFISTSINQTTLTNSFSYCFACLAGVGLGKTLVDNGTKCFVGYSKTVKVQLFFSAKDHFVECAIQGIKSFIEGRTILEAINEMKNIYTSKIDMFYTKDMLTASLFMNNRDAIIFHGDTTLTKKHFSL